MHAFTQPKVALAQSHMVATVAPRTSGRNRAPPARLVEETLPEVKKKKIVKEPKDIPTSEKSKALVSAKPIVKHTVAPEPKAPKTNKKPAKAVLAPIDLAVTAVPDDAMLQVCSCICPWPIPVC